MNYAEIHEQAVQWMNSRGWKNKWGKRGQFTQSLLQHTNIELNALCTLLPILADKAHYGLSLREQQATIVGTIAHDVGKETDEWQHYIEYQTGDFVPHVIPELTTVVVPELVHLFGFDEQVIGDATSFVNLHMSATRTPTSLMGVITGASPTPSSNRWNVLARIVEAVDKFCSIRGLLQVHDYLVEQKDSGAISPHIRPGYYLTALRGVSTTLLHRAADNAYQEAGWKPMLYFSNGTIYVIDSRSKVQEPSHDQIITELASQLEEVLDKDYSQLVVGTNFSLTVIPKPEFFNAKHLRQYLATASRRLRKAGFESAHIPHAKAAPEEVAKIEAVNADLIEKYLGHKPSTSEIKKHISRMAEQQPDMGVWIFFSAAYKLGLLGNLQHSFDNVFGPDSFERFLKCPKQRQFVDNMKYAVEIFGEMPGASFGYPKLAKAEDIPNEQNVRVKILIDRLVSIAEQAGSESVAPSSDIIAAQFEDDLIYPAKMADLRTEVTSQFDGYIAGKKRAFSKAAKSRTCPVCNRNFESGTVASSDFVRSPESHTNRAVSHGAAGYVVICDACKYERFLQQLLLGEKTQRVLVLTPRMHLGYWAGQTFYEKALQFFEEAQILMTNSTTNPNEKVTLTLTNLIARKLMRQHEEGSELSRVIQEGLDGKTLAHLLTYTLGGENNLDESNKKQREYWLKLEKALREGYELEETHEDITLLNEEWGTSFGNWIAVVDAVISGEVRNEIVDEIRSTTYNLRTQFKIVCHTPNFIMMPLSERSVGNFAVNKKESDTNAALRELFVLLLIGLALDCSVVAIDAGAPITFEGGEGVVRVPSVAAVRDLVGTEWLGLTQAAIWLEKIGAASLLQQDWDEPGKPGSSTLYQILTAMTPGHILRRIEMKKKQGVSVYHPQLILKALQEVPNA